MQRENFLNFSQAFVHRKRDSSRYTLFIILGRVIYYPSTYEDTCGFRFLNSWRFALRGLNWLQPEPYVLVKSRHHRLGYFARCYHVRCTRYEFCRRYDDVSIWQALWQKRRELRYKSYKYYNSLFCAFD